MNHFINPSNRILSILFLIFAGLTAHSQKQQDAIDWINKYGINQQKNLTDKWNQILDNSEIPKNEFEVDLKEIQIQLDEKNNDSAIVLLNRMEANYRSFWFIAYLKTQVFQYLDEEDSVKHYFEEAYSLDPLNEIVIEEYCRFLLGISENEQFEHWLDKGFTLNKSNGELYLLKCIYKIKSGQLADSRKLLTKGQKVASYSAEQYAYLGYCYAKKGFNTDANFYFNKSLRQSPKSYLVNYYASLYYFDRGWYPKARKCAEIMEAQDSLQIPALFISGILDVFEGKYFTGAKKLDKFYKSTYFKTTKFEELGYAENEYFAAVENFVTDFDSLQKKESEIVGRAIKNLIKGTPTAFSDSLEEYCKYNSKAFVAQRFCLLYQVLLGASETKINTTYFRLTTYGKASELQYVTVFFADAELYYNPEKAYKYYQLAAAVDTNYVYPRTKMKLTKLVIGKLSEYFNERIDSQKVSPDTNNTQAVLDLAFVYDAMGASDSILELFDTYSSFDYGYMQYKYMAFAYYRKGELDKAREYRNLYLKTSQESYYEYKDFRLKCYSYEEVKPPSHYEKSLINDIYQDDYLLNIRWVSTSPVPYLRLAKFYYLFEKFEDADSMLALIGESSGEYLDYWYFRGKLKLRTGDTASALASLKHAKLLSNSNPNVNLLLAYTFWVSGHHEQSQQLLEENKAILRNKEYQKLELISFIRNDLKDVDYLDSENFIGSVDLKSLWNTISLYKKIFDI